MLVLLRKQAITGRPKRPLGIPQRVFFARAPGAMMRISGGFAPVVGRVSMDYARIDLTDIPHAKPGDDVTLLDPDPLSPASVYALADAAGTIPHEVLTRIGPRIPRVGIDPADPVELKDDQWDTPDWTLLGRSAKLKLAGVICCIAAVCLGGFGAWGAFSDSGNRHFDEMAGMIPEFALVAGVALGLTGLILLLVGVRQSRRKQGPRGFPIDPVG